MSDNSYEQAGAQMDSILAMVAALECDYERLEDLRAEKAEWLADNPGNYIDPNDPRDSGRWATAYPDEADELAELIEAAGDCSSHEDAQDRITEHPLEVSVRSDWQSIGETLTPSEFRILLCTGGPAVQIRGELDDRNEPARAWIEHQDWYEPWQEYHGENVNTDAILTYCRQFYFGD